MLNKEVDKSDIGGVNVRYRMSGTKDDSLLIKNIHSLVK